MTLTPGVPLADRCRPLRLRRLTPFDRRGGVCGFSALALALTVVGCSRSPPELPEPGSFELHEQLEIHLFAAEPDVVDPVALAFDAAERMYVVEMRDYPEGLPPDGRPGGTIRLLEDTDRDGRADTSTVFAEGLSFPTSVTPWRGGVFVTAPPQILYLEDRDGDRRADLRQVVFDGFTLGVTDSNVNGLRWGIDNRIHGVNGGNGGQVRRGEGDDEARGEADGAAAPADPGIALRGLDFRFDPRTRALETTYHTAGGFGLAFDPWGRSFSPYNIDHLQQRFVPARYLERAPALPPLRATGNVSVHGAMARIFPISTPATRPNHPEQAGYFSSAGGIGWLDFPGGDLPRGILVCDVVGNLVSREVPRLEGAVYVTERAPEERARELFASRDPAFRPVGVEMGPDGALYLIDMQRDVIEHPDYIPEGRRRAIDLRAGSDRGRIYRVVPRRGLPPASPPLHQVSPERLVAELASPSRWRRDTAQRLLIERGGSGAAPLDALRALAGAGLSTDGATAPRVTDRGTDGPGSGAEPGQPVDGEGARDRALGRLHALWTLAGLGAATEEIVLAALVDPYPGVRENAIQIAETLLEGSSGRLPARIVAMAGDPSPRVRFQAALTLGEVDHPGRVAALEGILRRDAGQRWSRVAVASALGDGAAMVLSSLLRRGSAALEEEESVVRELADLVGAGLGREQGRELESLLRAAHDSALAPPVRDALMTGLESGIARSPNPPAGTATMSELLDRSLADGAPAIARAAWRMRRALGLADGAAQRRALAAAASRAADRSLAIEHRVAAVELLALGSHGEVAGALAALLAAGEPSELQAHAIRALAVAGEVHRGPSPAESPAGEDADLGPLLVDRFGGLGPPARSAAIAVLLHRPALHAALVSALEDGRLGAGELNLDLEQRRRLLRSPAPGIATRAASVLDDDDYGNRAAAVEAWLARLPLEGSAERGRVLFERLCAQCHRAADGAVGHEVGPDLASLRHRSVEDLVSNILDPDLAIHPAYVAFEAALRSGERVVGLIEAESAAAVTLLQAGGERRVLQRAELAALASTGRSLMPAGLEQGLDAQGLRDLVALIQDGGQTEKRESVSESRGWGCGPGSRAATGARRGWRGSRRASATGPR